MVHEDELPNISDHDLHAINALGANEDYDARTSYGKDSSATSFGKVSSIDSLAAEKPKHVAESKDGSDHEPDDDSDLIAKSLDISYRSLENGKTQVEAVYLDPHDWRRQGPRLLTGVQAMAALSRKNIAARDKYRSVNALLENCRTDFLREQGYLKEWLRRLGHKDEVKPPDPVVEQEDSQSRSSSKSKDEDEFFRYLVYADFPMDAMTKSILLRDIRKANEEAIAEREWLRSKVKLLGGGEYSGLIKILQNSGMKVTAILLALIDLCEEDKEKKQVVDIATNDLKARVAAMEAKVKTVEQGELPTIRQKAKESEEMTAKQKDQLENLAHNIEKIEQESEQIKEETAASQKEITVLELTEKKWTEKGNVDVGKEVRKELAEIREQKQKEVREAQRKVQQKLEQCEKVEKDIVRQQEIKVQMAVEIETRKQELKANLERAEMEAVAATSAAMDVELHARKEEEEAQELHVQEKQLVKEVKEVEKEIEKRHVPPMSEEKLKAAQAALEKANKENKEIEQKDASLKLEIRAVKRKVEKLEEEIVQKTKEAEEAAAEAAKNSPKEAGTKTRKSVIQKGLKDLKDIAEDEDPDLIPYQMRLRHPEFKNQPQTNKQRLSNLFSDAKGQAARTSQLRQDMAQKRQTMISAQFEAMGTAAQEDYPVVGLTGPVDLSDPVKAHDGDRLGLFSGLETASGIAEISTGGQGQGYSQGRGSMTSKEGALDVRANSPHRGSVHVPSKSISAYRYDKGNNENVDLKLAAAQRRLQCTSERLDKMASKEARLKADLNSCIQHLHHWIEQENKLCKEVNGELSELIAAFTPNSEAQEKAKERLENVYATYVADSVSLHTLMEAAEESAEAGDGVTDKQQTKIDAANRKVHKADETVCGALEALIECIPAQEGFRKLVQGCLNEHMDIEKQIEIARTQRLETREGVTRWGTLYAEERAALQQIRCERHEWMKKEKILTEQAAAITLELMREAQAVADIDFDASKRPKDMGATAASRMGQTSWDSMKNQSHNESTSSWRSFDSRNQSPERVQRMKVVPHGVNANVSNGIEMDYSIPSKEPKGNKKSLFPVLIKDHWSPEDDYDSSVSTAATTAFNLSTTSFNTSFGPGSPDPNIPGSRDGERLIRHLGQDKWPEEMQKLRAGTAEPRLNGRSVSQTQLPTHQTRTPAYRKSPALSTPTSGDDLRVAQVGRLRHTPLPMRHESAKGRPTDRGYVPEERWARPLGMRLGFGARMPDRTY